MIIVKLVIWTLFGTQTMIQSHNLPEEDQIERRVLGGDEQASGETKLSHLVELARSEMRLHTKLAIEQTRARDHEGRQFELEQIEGWLLVLRTSVVFGLW